MKSHHAQNLNELFQLMISNNPLVTRNQEWSTDLPIFGGETPDCTAGVWSWDETRLIVGTCNDDLEIVRRDAWGKEINKEIR